MDGDVPEEHAQIASDVGRRLTQGRYNKDSLLKLLKQAANSLSKLKQSTSLKDALAPLNDFLIQSNMLQHKDTDVQLLVAVCLTEIIRILAPETPFSDTTFKAIFKLIVNKFADLRDIGSPYFTWRVRILETVAAIQCCVLMLDIGCEKLVIELFNVFFSVVREDHQPSLIRAMLSIMTHILEENVTMSLVQIILRNLLKDEKGKSSASCKLAVSVIQSTAEKLEPFICALLLSCISERDAVRFELKESYHETIFMIFQYAPKMLSSVIPKLTLELVTDQVDVRIKAVQLVGKLFSHSKLHAAVEHRPLFVEFLRRFSDKSAEVRMHAIECAQACYTSNMSLGAALEILAALEERLLDTDDKVRTQAVNIVCDLAACNLTSFPSSLMLRAAERLRDKKAGVRKKAMQRLLKLYRVYCNSCSEGLAPFSDDFEKIPSKILSLCFDKECKEFRPQNMELVIADDLFPANLSTEERVNHWIAFFSFFSMHHKRALSAILSQKRRLQLEMRGYLAFRETKEYLMEEQQKNSYSFVKMTTSFSDASKAEIFLQKLHQMKDSYIFEVLANLIDERMASAALASAKDSLLKRIGEKHPDFEYFRVLSLKCSHTIFTSEHVQCFLKILCSSQAAGDRHAKTVFGLLNIVLSIFPSLLRGSETSFQKLFTGQSNLWDEDLLHVLARAVEHISINLSDVNPFLERFCLEGTRSQSKVAISVITALGDASEHSIYLDLFKKLLEFLRCGRNLPAVLQSLGCIANQSKFMSGSQLEEVVENIFQKLFPSSSCNSSNLKMLKCIPISCDSWNLKAYGLKALVKIFLVPQICLAKYPIENLLEVLLKILQEDAIGSATPSNKDWVHLRYAAAKAVLLLSSRWDMHISPRLFHKTVSFSRSLSSSVSKFLRKIQRLLKKGAIPNRYACAFAIAASYCDGDVQSDSKKYLAKFVEEYTCKSSTGLYSDDEGTMMRRAEYLVVFLVHTLAHDRNFPLNDWEDVEAYARLCWPLVVILQTLIGCLNDGHMNDAGDVVSCLVSIFRAVKKAEDAVDSHNTYKIHMLSHIGTLVIRHLCPDIKPEVNAHRRVFLPSSFYKVNHNYKSEEYEYISKLSEGFIERMLKFGSDQVTIFSDQGLASSNKDLASFDVNGNMTKGSVLEEHSGYNRNVTYDGESMDLSKLQSETREIIGDSPSLVKDKNMLPCQYGKEFSGDNPKDSICVVRDKSLGQESSEGSIKKKGKANKNNTKRSFGEDIGQRRSSRIRLSSATPAEPGSEELSRAGGRRVLRANPRSVS